MANFVRRKMHGSGALNIPGHLPCRYQFATLKFQSNWAYFNPQNHILFILPLDKGFLILPLPIPRLTRPMCLVLICFITMDIPLL